jgi:universal stress protein A
MPDAPAYRHILALAALDAFDRPVLARAALLARLSGAQLSVLHVVEPDAALDGGYPAGSAASRAAAMEQAARRRLEFLAAQAGVSQAVCHAVQGQQRQVLQRELQVLRPDLVVMGRPDACPPGAFDTLILAATQRRGGRLLSSLGRWLAPQLSV